MQYRKPADKRELETYHEMVRLAFNASHGEANFWQSVAPLDLDNSRVLVDDSGKLLCGMGILDDALYFNSPDPIPTALITAVASPPEHRRKGYIRQLFLAMFDEQRARGVALTALYPFYFPFYRSFGYELAHEAANHLVKIGQFKQWRKAADTGSFVPLDTKGIKTAIVGDSDKKEGESTGAANDTSDGAADLEKLEAIYKEWASRNLGAIARTKQFWIPKFAHKEQFVPAYLYLDGKGRPAGYIIYHLEDKDNWQREMVIHEMMAVDRPAREAIYGFISNHDSQAAKVNCWLPVDSGFSTLLPDPRETEVKVRPGYMLRLIDVERAFRQRTFKPEAEGEFTFSLTDEMLPALNGTYRVCVKEGKADAEKTKDGDAGVSLDARRLAQLYGGYLSPVKSAAMGLIEVSRQADLAGMQAVFSPPGQPLPYMADDF